jgi:flagellar protein FliJ
MQTLTTLLEQAESQRNVALAAFNQARARRDSARDQARDLDTYRSDYQHRWSQQFRSRAATPDIVRCYQQFAERLELAIAQQAQTVEVTEQALTRAGETLSAHELRVASVRKLIERRQQEARRSADRREQAANDEMAQRVAARRAAMEGTPP